MDNKMPCYVCILIGLVSACGRTPDPVLAGGELRAAVEQAKSRGESTAVLMSYIERATDGELEPLLERLSIGMMTPVESQVEVTRDNIITWQRFRVERWLRQRPLDTQCHLRIPVEVSHNEVVAPFLRGEAIVDGVAVREVTMEHIQFESSRRYLLFANRCPDNGITVPNLEYGVFWVVGDGKIELPPFNNGNAPYVRQLLELGTIQALENRLVSFPSP